MLWILDLVVGHDGCMEKPEEGIRPVEPRRSTKGVLSRVDQQQGVELVALKDRVYNPWLVMNA